VLLKSDRYKQIIFLVLVISGTIVLYSSNIWKDDSNFKNEIIPGNKDNITDMVKNEKDALRLSGIFLKNTGSQEGIDALFSLIVHWHKTGNNSSIQSAMKTFEAHVKNDSLKNKLYGKLGRYFLAVNMKLNSKEVEKIILDSFDSVNAKKILKEYNNKM
jgi:hypothetical protein